MMIVITDSDNLDTKDNERTKTRQHNFKQVAHLKIILLSQIQRFETKKMNRMRKEILI